MYFAVYEAPMKILSLKISLRAMYVAMHGVAYT